jgi:hypothetical protein
MQLMLLNSVVHSAQMHTISQIAGAAKFSNSAKLPKMTQKQRPRCQEYLEAFDKCVCQIPWRIMTLSQIDQYFLPRQLPNWQFDCASEYDVWKTMVDCKNGKHMRPTEVFVSNNDIDNWNGNPPILLSCIRCTSESQ